MKKVILSTACIAVTFMCFAFAPTHAKQINNKAASKMSVVAGTCDTKYDTDVTFSHCNKTWTEPATPVTSEIAVLAQY